MKERENGNGAIPAPPEGFTLIEPQKAPPPPAGFSLVASDAPKAPQKAGGFGGIASEVGKMLYDLPVQAVSGFAQALEGTEPYSNTDWKDEAIQAARTRHQERLAEPGADTPLPFGLTGKDFRDTGASLGFTAVSAGAGVAAGVPAAIAAGPVAGYAAGGFASGGAAHQMAANSFVRSIIEAEDEESIQKTGTPLTDEQKRQRQAEIQDQAGEYGLWEAIPEAVGNVAGLKIIATPLKKMLGKNVAARVMSKLGGLYGTELATETVTQMGQNNVEAQFDAERERRSFSDPAAYLKSLKEVMPQVFILTTLMGGAGTAGVAAYRRGVEDPRKATAYKNATADPTQLRAIPDKDLDSLLLDGEDLIKRRKKDDDLKVAVDTLKKERDLRKQRAEILAEMPGTEGIQVQGEAYGAPEEIDLGGFQAPPAAPAPGFPTDFNQTTEPFPSAAGIQVQETSVIQDMAARLRDRVQAMKVERAFGQAERDQAAQKESDLGRLAARARQEREQPSLDTLAANARQRLPDVLGRRAELERQRAEAQPAAPEQDGIQVDEETGPRNTAMADALRQAGAVGPEEIRPKSGNPYKTEASARNIIKIRKLKGFEPVEVDGGWVLQKAGAGPAPAAQGQPAPTAIEPTPTGVPEQVTTPAAEAADTIPQETVSEPETVAEPATVPDKGVSELEQHAKSLANIDQLKSWARGRYGNDTYKRMLESGEIGDAWNRARGKAPAAAAAPKPEKQAQAFTATHELPDGTLVRAVEGEKGVYVDSDGQEYEEPNATEVSNAQQVQAEKAPAAASAAEEGGVKEQGFKQDPYDINRYFTPDQEITLKALGGKRDGEFVGVWRGLKTNPVLGMDAAYKHAKKLKSDNTSREGGKPVSDKPIGQNAQGEDIFEDEKGVRYVKRGNIRINQKVELRPTRAGMKAEPVPEDRFEVAPKIKTITVNLREGTVSEGDYRRPVDKAASEAATSPKNDTQAPTQAQQEAGNYKVGINGMQVSIENPAGSWRYKIDEKRLEHVIDELKKADTPAAKKAIRQIEQGLKILRSSAPRPKIALKFFNQASVEITRQHPPLADVIDEITEAAWAHKMAHHYGYFLGTVGPDKDHVDVFLGPNAEDPAAKAFIVDQVNQDGSFDEPKVMLGFPSVAAARNGYLSNYEKGWTGLGAITEFSVDSLKAWLADPVKTKKPAAAKMERRKDLARRKRVDQMTEAEMRRELLTDTLTGLGNRRAYDEALADQPDATHAYMDVDALKWVNDNMGHTSGDELLKAMGEAVKEALSLQEAVDGPRATGYHLSGDEFVILADTPEAAEAIAIRAQEVAKSAEIEYTGPDGSRTTKTGVEFSYGIGQDLKTADAALQRNKAEREAAGLRAPRGGIPAGVVKEPAEGRKAEVQGAAQQITVKQPGKHLTVSKRFTGILDKELQAAGVDSTHDDITIHFRDPKYSAKTGGYHPVEVAIQPDGTLRYITDYTYAGPENELVKEIDFDFENKIFGHNPGGYAKDFPLIRGRGLYKTWQSNFSNYYDMGVFEVEVRSDKLREQGARPAGIGEIPGTTVEIDQTPEERLLVARNQLIAFRNQEAQQGRVVDDRLLSRIRRQEQLVKDLEREVKGAANEASELNAKPAQPEKAKSYGKSNKVFTEDAAAKARELLKKKLGNLNAGIDPEILQAGLTLAGYHIEAGARAFADYAKAMVSDLGEGVRPYLRSWYESVRHYPGFDNAGMTSPEDIERVGQPQENATLADDLYQGRRFGSITEARKRLAELTGGAVAQSGTVEAKRADEQIEQAGVLAARRIVDDGMSEAETFDRLQDLSDRMPSLNVRTSTSIAQQAYSTPFPLAYLASRLAGIDRSKSVLEPTAGNGALLVEASPANTMANELNADRRRFLSEQGFEPYGEDASAFDFGAPDTDVVIANPPFGLVKDSDGNTKKFPITEQYSTSEIDHAISLNALKAMKDDGRAVLIIGGPNKILSDDARSDAYNGKAKRTFFYTLYNQYRVVDHFTVSGDLYAKQGAAWPVDVIVIDGRGKSDRALPAADLPRKVNTAEELRNELTYRGDRQASEGSARAGGQSPGGNGRTGEPPIDSRDGGRLTDGDAGRVLDGLDGQPSFERGDVATNDRGPERVRDGRGTGAQPDSVENSYQAPYQPASKSPSVGTLLPVNLREPVSRSLEKVADRYGSVDQFVADELGYDVDDIPGYFSAEQVDALALALDNMKRDKGFIIGDQTGVGKGRVVAGMIRWAKRQGKMPIFVTERPNLFADMMRDLADIGMPDAAPFLTKTSQSIPLDSEALAWFDDAQAANEKGKRPPKKRGRFLTSSGPQKQGQLMAGMMAGDEAAPDMIFTMYSQLQTVRGARTQRMDFIQHFARDGVVIFDESHNAGGSTVSSPFGDKDEFGKTGRAAFAREIAREASGVFYSSATYAKRPDVMDLYFKTDMGEGMSGSELTSAIKAGGVPLQQVVATMLADAGQYIRREKSFDGIAYETVSTETDKQFAENAATIMRGIMRFDKMKKAAIKAMDKQLKADARQLSGDNSTGGAGAMSTNFTSVMHNLLGQMLLTLTVDAASNRAIEALKSGQKPVIAVSNTMGSAIEEYAELVDLKPGDPIALSFGDLMKRYLEKSRRIIEGSPFGEKTSRQLSDAELGPAVIKFYDGLMQRIDEMGFDRVPISPIDAIHQKLRDAGYKTGEITGRGSVIDYSSGTPIYRRRKASEQSTAGKTKTINDFNSGNIDAVILNQSGATGLSLHASERFSDQSPRVMVLAQAELNIDTHMQMLGRINRTGQVVLPRYEQLVPDIAASKRPASILAKKMASLNANTTGARDSALKAKDTPDFMNEYGDQVAAQVMADNPDWHDALGNPLKGALTGEGLDSTDAMRKVSGRIPVLSLENQAIVYDTIEEAYLDLLDTMKRSGQNILEAETLDLDAVVKETREVRAPANESGSPFAAPVSAEIMDVKRIGKPLRLDQIDDLIRKEIGADVGADLDRSSTAWAREQVENVRNDFAAYRAEIADNFGDEQEKMRDSTLSRLDFQASKVMAELSYGLNRPVELTSPHGEVYLGIVGKLERTGKSANPVAPGTWKVTIYVADAARQLKLPLSRIGTSTENGTFTLATADRAAVEEAFTSAQSQTRETRTIMTGNLLAAFGTFNQGQIVNFKMSDGSLRQGIMMPRRFNLDEAQSSLAVVFNDKYAAARFLRELDGIRFLHSPDKAVRIGSHQDGYILRVPAAKAAGARYFLNDNLMAAAGGEFVKSGADMRVMFPDGALPQVLEVLYDLGVKLQATSRKEEAERFAGPASFSRGGGTGTTVDAVQAELDALLNPSGRKAMGDILTVVQSDSNLPASLQHPDGGVRGVTDPATGKVYLVADNLGDNAKGVFLHEVGVHYGLRELLGDRFGDVLAQMRGLRTVKNKAAQAAYAKVPRDTARDRVDEEALAYLVEDAAARDMGIVRKVIAAVRAFLFRQGFLVRALTPDDMLAMASAAARKAVSGRVEPAADVGADPLYSRITENAQAIYEAQRSTWAEKGGALWDSIKEAASGPLGNLPGVDTYLKTRYQTLGRIAEIDEGAKAIYEAFANAGDDIPAVYEFLTSREATPQAIRSRVVRDKAVEVKGVLEDIGQQLVDRGLLSEEAFENNRGQYLPRIYLKHLLRDSDIALIGTGKKPSDLGYLKQRKDIPEEIRRLILGEITDPGYLASKGFGQQSRDIALLDWLGKIASNRDWVWQQSLVDWSWTDRNGVTRTRRATPFWLMAEADRLRAQAHYLDVDDARASRTLAERMEEAGRSALDDIDTSNIPNDFKQMPNSPRYGSMRGLIVRKEIYNDIVGTLRITTGDESFAEKILGHGGLATKATQLWKWPLALDTRLPTPTGWTTMGEVQVGDRLFDEHGRVCDVLEVKEVLHGRECFEVGFSDGAKIVADRDHLWFVLNSVRDAKILTTGQIMDTLTTGPRGDHRHSVPVTEALILPDVDLPIPPYALGVWLGDGCSGSARVCAGKDDVNEIIDNLERSGVRCSEGTTRQDGLRVFAIQKESTNCLRNHDPSDVRPNGKGCLACERERKKNALSPVTNPDIPALMRDQGILDDKHIPSLYLRASKEQRMELLRGLMDTDGWADKNRCSFGTSNPRLRDDVVELLRSLGYKPVVREHQPTNTATGKQGKTAWKIQYAAYADEPVFHLERKRDRLAPAPKTRQRSRTRQIVSVTPVPSVPVRCIGVSSRSELFLAGDGFIPTHNSKVAANPPAQIRNFVSNGVLLHLSGVPFHKVPLRVIQAVKQIRARAQGRPASEWKHYDVARRYGVTESTFSAQELIRMERDLLALEARNANKISMATLKHLAGIVMDKTGDWYQFAEGLFKTAKIIDAMERQGKSEGDAALEAQKWLFDYSLIGPSTRYLRNAPVGIPFLTFHLKALPRMLEVARTAPWRFAPYVALPYVLTSMVAGMADVDDDDVKALQKALPDWLQSRGHAYVLPIKDDSGRWQAMDFGYFLPWTMWTSLVSETANGDIGDAMMTSGVLGGPLPDLIAAIQTNRDPFTGRDIINEADPPGRQIVSMLSYLYGMAMPTWLTNYGAVGHLLRAGEGEVDRYGLPKTGYGQAAARLVGVNLYPIDPETSRSDNLRRMRFEIGEISRRMRQQLRNPNLSAEDRTSVRDEYLELIRARMEQMAKYGAESKVHPNLRRE